ncbi:MAG TPA: NADH-quinone oxidoreductase subunit NuoN [Gammaproteobacteria bacterium]|nr:NADH-quinone oxidoreductase subunit NuoN [Gammaproteobacteria bacterium]
MPMMPDFSLAMPEIWVGAMACVILMTDLFIPGRDRVITMWLSVLTLAVAAWLTIDRQWGVQALTFSDSYVADNLAVVLKVSIYAMAALAFVYAQRYLKQRGLLHGEFFVLGLFGVLGMMVVSSSASLLTAYIGLELLALCQYALVAFNRNSRLAAEAAMKYFVLGALSSGMLLYGMSMLYGVTGSLDLAVIATAAAEANDNILYVFGLIFMLVGIAFKFGAVPFHMWIPDVYEGAPTPVTLYIGTAPKIAALALFLRLLAEGLGALQDQWQLMLVILAVLSLIVGNLFAIVQSNFKRLLGYSTISHIGFILLGLVAGTDQGFGAALFYVVTYAITAAGTFAVIILLSREGFEGDRLDDLKGLFRRDGWAAFALLLMMFSMTGVPGTVGFYAKLLVIQALVDAGMVWLAVFAVVFAVIGAFYYLRVLKIAFFDPVEDTQALQASGGFRAVLTGNALVVLLLGIFPGSLIAVCLAAFG